LEQNVFGMPQDRLAQRYTKMDMPKVDAPKIPVQLPVAVATTWIPASKVQIQSEPKISMPKFDMPKISSPTGGYDWIFPVGEGSRVTCLGFFQPLGGGGGSKTADDTIASSRGPVSARQAVAFTKMLTVELKARDLRAANGKEATGQSRQGRSLQDTTGR
jgi:hypothetical protein